jgi:hypothetical protein
MGAPNRSTGARLSHRKNSS